MILIKCLSFNVERIAEPQLTNQLRNTAENVKISTCKLVNIVKKDVMLFLILVFE